MRFLVFGDSIAYGSWDSEGGWVDRVKIRAHKATVDANGDTKTQVVNLGVGGDTSTKLLARMDGEIKSRLSPSWPLGIIIAVGVNDSRTVDGVAEVPIEHYKQNVQEILTTAHRYTDKVFVVGLTPVNGATIELKGQIYSNERIAAYDEALRDVAGENNVIFVPLRDSFVDSGVRNLFSYDGIHPNDTGHKKILQQVLPELEKWGVTL